MRANVHGESLVEVHVANVTTTGRRIRQSNLGIEIGAIEINLAAVVVYDLAGLIPSCQLSSRPEHT